MLKTRLWMGTLLIAVLAGGLWIDERLGQMALKGMPRYPCWLVVALAVVLACCRELHHLMSRRGFNPNWLLVYASLAGITVSNWIPFFVSPSADRMEHLVWALSAVCIANMLMLIREGFIFREPGTALVNACGAIFATFYLGALAAFLIELRWAGPGLVALAAHIAAAKCGDIGAYFGGRALGRHKLCPWLSPNKTVEGAIAGLFSSVLGAVAILAIGAELSGRPPAMNWVLGSFFGFTVGLLGMVGDLIESLIKRDCQQKDASDLVPGFGGVLDVLDSPLFSAPAAFGFWAVLA